MKKSIREYLCSKYQGYLQMLDMYTTKFKEGKKVKLPRKEKKQVKCFLMKEKGKLSEVSKEELDALWGSSELPEHLESVSKPRNPFN